MNRPLKIDKFAHFVSKYLEFVFLSFPLLLLFAVAVLFALNKGEKTFENIFICVVGSVLYSVPLSKHLLYKWAKK